MEEELTVQIHAALVAARFDCARPWANPVRGEIAALGVPAGCINSLIDEFQVEGVAWGGARRGVGLMRGVA